VSCLGFPMPFLILERSYQAYNLSF
jgi:hypothetical protein